ncbi:MAG: hypothetical protein RJA36_682 [Pseudomonadota bacterium]
MLALVLNALLPLAAQAMLATPERSGSMEICSSTGMVMVQPHPLQKAGADEQPGQAADLAKDCPFCQLHHGGVGLPPAAAGLFQPLEFTGMPPAFYQAAPCSTVWLSARSRAPPLLA